MSYSTIFLQNSYTHNAQHCRHNRTYTNAHHALLLHTTATKGYLKLNFCHRSPNAVQSDCERSPIRLRTQPNRIANAAQSDCERERIGLRSKNDDFCIDFALFI